MKKIVILISGRGSNMQAIVEAGIPGAEIAAVISNRPDAAGLIWANERGIPTLALDHKAYASRDEFDAVLADKIEGMQPDLLVLAGYMRILTPVFVNRFAGRMLNIHPSLLPAYPGLHTHQRAIEDGLKIAGCTVHFVTAELDHGPVVAQAAVPVLDEDSADTLAARVLKQEHQLYPAAVRAFISGDFALVAGRVRYARPLDESAALRVPG
ncbi:phosphoribosylglycinamide formyltransferase [Chitinilyticum piscinae]|uniref:Phosphoribosylglycinamide formyltransferase n=1 Tax=Chitinilyticum piscinae TaxID=2866724 RepID=A0A8J7FJK3_9NEIS|nr:phosphoribosylglycinamide formyltransferase [Chitinilyticum piscinae]MBE9610555.1 phosphoribosylglycinamide formyltransferase [Chitinilyticum piscinae]